LNEENVGGEEQQVVQEEDEDMDGELELSELIYSEISNCQRFIKLLLNV